MPPPTDIKILLGYLNAKIRREEIYQGLIRRYSNGQRLVDFVAAKNMVVSSTCFPHKEIHKQTWRSPNGKTNNQTDHILINKRNARSILDVKSCRGGNSDSDHFLVKGKYRCKIAYSKHELNRNTRKFHVEKQQDPSTATRFRQQIRKEFEKLGKEQAVEELINIEEEWKQIKVVAIEAAEQTIGYQPKTRQEKMVR
jgi:hypothetical protein